MSQVQIRPEQADSLVRTAGPYDYLPQALADIHRGCDGHSWAQAIRGYIELGLYDPARELLDRIDRTVRQQPELVAMEASLANRGTGQLNWNTCAGRFARNLEVLIGRQDRFAAIADAWDTARDAFELYRTTDGNYQLSSRGADGRRCWLGGLAEKSVFEDDAP